MKNKSKPLFWCKKFSDLINLFILIRPTSKNFSDSRINNQQIVARYKSADFCIHKRGIILSKVSLRCDSYDIAKRP